jgi:hypothetical protein
VASAARLSPPESGGFPTFNQQDRPHLATRAHYERVLFASLPLNAKVTPEQVLDQRARIAKPPWPMWSYGKRGDMIRDLHWPVRNADGKLVSKEAAGNASGYVHSHLLHAYIGNSQDVVPEQIECRNYRRRRMPSPARRARLARLGSEWSPGAHPAAAAARRNPFFMLESDGLMPNRTPKPAISVRSGSKRGLRFSSPRQRREERPKGERTRDRSERKQEPPLAS